MKTYILPILGMALLLASCEAEMQKEIMQNSTVQASMDFADVHEVGNSSIRYDGRTKTNVIAYTEYYMGGVRMYGADKDMSADGVSGLMADKVSPKLGFRFGLEYIGKGAKFPGASNDFAVNLNYLAVPLDVMYHYPAGPGTLEGGLGPFLAYGIGGKAGNVSSFGQDNGGFKRFDAGLDLQAGYQLDNGVSFRLAYDLGLANVEYATEDVRGHTRAFSINVGYQIGKLFTKKK